MDKPAEWREMLLQYRLNELDETRRDEIDALLITDPDFSAAMQEAEYDLLDAYAAHELSGRDRLRVERALRPAGRFSLEAPGHVIRASATPQLVTASNPLPSRSWMYLLAIAAALVVAAAVTSPRWRPHPAPQQAIAPPAQPAQQPGAPQPDPPPITAPNKPNPASTVATVLLPGALRSQGALSLTLGGDVKTVRFVLPSRPDPNPDQPIAEGYELQVVGDDGQLACRSPGHEHPLSFTCPAASLPSGPSFVRVVALPSNPDDAPLLEVALSVGRR